MLTARKTGRYSERRLIVARPRRRVYVGSTVTRSGPRRVFFGQGTQHMTAPSRLGDWLGAAVTLAGIAGWVMLVMLVGA